MRITPDTNVLVRAIVSDDTAQAEAARRCLDQADEIVLTLSALCEMAWVLKSFYGASREDVAVALRKITGAENALFDSLAVDTGLALLDGGGDFADGVIAGAGLTASADVFVSFDRDALRRLTAAGIVARPPH